MHALLRRCLVAWLCGANQTRTCSNATAMGTHFLHRVSCSGGMIKLLLCVVFNSDTRYLVYITCPFSYSGTLCCCSGLFFLLLVSIIVYPFSYSMPTNRCLCLVFGPLFQTASTFSKRKRREKLLIACEIKKYLKSHQCAWYKVCRFFKCSTKSDSFCTQRFRYLQQ